MIWLYRLVFWPIFLVFLPGYVLKLSKRGGKWHIAERFGIIHPPAKKKEIRRLWIHAVSVGELNAIKPLLQKIKENKNWEVALSVTTTTARKLAEEKFEDLYAYLFTFPIDIFSGRIFKELQPDKLVLMEGELWPETLHQALKHKVAAYLINARLSDRSFNRLTMIKGLARRLLQKVSRIMTATAQDTERYLGLGANPELLCQTGSLKFDAPVGKPIDETTRAGLLASLGFGSKDVIIVGSSTWAPEEEALLMAYQVLKSEFRNLKLLLVPRHAERRDEVEALLKKSGLRYHRRAAGPVQGNPEVVLADTTGELSMLQQLGSIIFVGKSLYPNKEGQTPIEPAAAGKAVLMGQGMSNFKLIARDLVNAGGGRFVGSPGDLREKLRELLSKPELRQEMGVQARGWFQKNRGATDKTLEWLEL